MSKNLTPIKVLFILKQREALYENETEAEGQYSKGILHSGLFNSASFMNDMLIEQGVQSNLVHVIDNNCIDREVTKYKPNVVIIEAFWVVPEKFDILTKLHPNVKWVIRNHSKTPFLANEGIAFGWAMRYTETKNVFLSSNSVEANDDMISLMMTKFGISKEEATAKCPYLPNYYPIEQPEIVATKNNPEVNISCFGAIRPLKNHMVQAVAAIKFANKHGKKLKFHINGNRVEGNGNAILKNLRQLFEHLPHELVEHAWMPHDKFLSVVKEMDIGLQVSYTETFNIVAADHFKVGVPVIVSDEIEWVGSCLQADPNDTNNIAKKLEEIWYASQLSWLKKFVIKQTIRRMHLYNKRAVFCWISQLDSMVGDVSKM